MIEFIKKCWRGEENFWKVFLFLVTFIVQFFAVGVAMAKEYPIKFDDFTSYEQLEKFLKKKYLNSDSYKLVRDIEKSGRGKCFDEIKKSHKLILCYNSSANQIISPDHPIKEWAIAIKIEEDRNIADIEVSGSLDKYDLAANIPIEQIKNFRFEDYDDPVLAKAALLKLHPVGSSLDDLLKTLEKAGAAVRTLEGKEIYEEWRTEDFGGVFGYNYYQSKFLYGNIWGGAIHFDKSRNITKVGLGRNYEGL